MNIYMSINKVEGPFLKQKSRNQWLNLGDHINSYFHRVVKVFRNSKNLIKHMWGEKGKKVEDVEQIKRVAVEFYKKLLGSISNQFDELKAERIRQLVKKSISEDQSNAMQKEVSTKEIKKTIFEMKSGKPPGAPDGFSADFFTKAWPILGRMSLSN